MIKETRDLPGFHNIEASGVAEVLVSQGTPQRVDVEADDNLMLLIDTEVADQTLVISTKKIKNATELRVHITIPEVHQIHASGATEVRGMTILQAEHLIIEGSGATEIALELAVKSLETILSGAAEISLDGMAASHQGELSGAASLDAFDLQTQITSISASGASSARVNATEELSIETSGAADVQYRDKPVTLILEKPDLQVKESESEGVIVISTDEWDEETNVKVGGISVRVKDDDTVRIIIGNKVLIVDENGHVEFTRSHKKKFNGHWGGFHLGINGYVDPDFSITVPDEYDFLDLKYQKSIDVQLNVYEQNFNLIRNHLGLITGIGFTWNNYHYSRDLHFVADSSRIYAYHGKEGNEFEPAHPERNYQKSKLKVTYLTIPLLLEYQTNRHSRANSFHLTAGVVGGVRLGTKSKVMWENSGTTKEKQWDDYHMNPFRWNAYAGIGWGIINLYATYSLNPLFQENDGPELYPFSVGITLVGW